MAKVNSKQMTRFYFDENLIIFWMLGNKNTTSKINFQSKLTILFLKILLTEDLKVVNMQKTCLIIRSVKPAFNQSFDLLVEENSISTSFITLELRHRQAFAVTGSS